MCCEAARETTIRRFVRKKKLANNVRIRTGEGSNCSSRQNLNHRKGHNRSCLVMQDDPDELELQVSTPKRSRNLGTLFTSGLGTVDSTDLEGLRSSAGSFMESDLMGQPGSPRLQKRHPLQRCVWMISRCVAVFASILIH